MKKLLTKQFFEEPGFLSPEIFVDWERRIFDKLDTFGTDMASKLKNPGSQQTRFELFPEISNSFSLPVSKYR